MNTYTQKKKVILAKILLYEMVYSSVLPEEITFKKIRKLVTRMADRILAEL